MEVFKIEEIWKIVLDLPEKEASVIRNRFLLDDTPVDSKREIDTIFAKAAGFVRYKDTKDLFAREEDINNKQSVNEECHRENCCRRQAQDKKIKKEVIKFLIATLQKQLDETV